MIRRPIWTVLLAVGFSGVFQDFARSAALLVPTESSVVAQESAAIPESFPLPPGTVFQKVVVGADAAAAVASGEDERLIYSNTLGINTIRFGNGQLISDDITTTAPVGCNLTRFSFKVVGRVKPADPGGAYTVRYSLYNNCPQAVPSAQRAHYTDEAAPNTGIKIRGTDGEITFPDDAPRIVEHIVADPSVVPIPTNLWLGISFTRANCGSVVGAPAMVGHSADIMDFSGGPACNSFLGGFPEQPHASFWAEMYGGTNCPDSFVAYKAAKASAGQFSAGGLVPFLDDVKLIVNNCQMIGYEVAVKGQGFYQFDLVRDCGAPPPWDPYVPAIPGTYKTFIVTLNTQPQLQLARFAFDPPIPLNADALFFRFIVNNTTGGVVFAGVQPAIGSSSEDYFLINWSGGCEPRYPPPPYYQQGVFHASITCAGSLPVGACCDMAVTQCQGGPDDGKRCQTNDECTPPGTCESVCREVPRINCPWPWPPGNQPAWVEGATCDSSPFPHTCGLSACCKTDDTCDNLTEAQCLATARPGETVYWKKGLYCDTSSLSCLFNACRYPYSTGDCSVAHQDAGCSWITGYRHVECCERVACCQIICEQDAWCCQVEWDRACVDRAETQCTLQPSFDRCADTSDLRDPFLVGADSVTYFTNFGATEDATDPGFCCNAGAPGATGFGSVWFKFVATDESAQIDTCFSDSAGDSLVNVFSVGDPTSESTACQTLSLIGCGDDDGCSNGDKHSRFCVDGLTPGQTYYIMLASKTPETKGTHQLELKSPCQYLVPFPSGDCNNNGALDGCDMANGTSSDCNGNRIPDECEIADGHEQDCNANGLPDSCDIASGASLDCQPNGIPDECDLRSGNGVFCDCDADGVPDECNTPWARVVSDPSFPSFGYQVAIEGDRLLVAGDYEKRSDDDWIPALDIFVRRGLKWFREGKLVLPEEVGRYAYVRAIALDHDRVFAGVQEFDWETETDRSAIYVFTRSEKGWLFEKKLANPDPASLRYFGSALDASNDRLVTSASRVWAGNEVTGEVMAYHREGPDWVLDARIRSPDAPELVDRFGGIIDLDGDRLAVGDYGYSGYSESRAGAVFLFRRQGTQWIDEAKIESPIGSADFADRLALRNSVLVVSGLAGVRPPNSYARAGHVFALRNGRWTFESELPDPNALQRGYVDSVAVINHGVVMVGSTGGDDLTTRGLVYARTSKGDWNLVKILRTPDRLPGEYVSSSIIGDDRTVIIGNAVTDGQRSDSVGAVYSFSLPRIDCQPNGLWDACEIRDDRNSDCNGDHVPDDCEPRSFGDFDFDGRVDLRDFAGLQRCFTGNNATLAPCCGIFDLGPRDGDVDLGDAAAFPAKMTGP